MKNAIIVHGKPSREKFENPDLFDPSDSMWIPRVKHQLTLNGFFAVAPDMPKPYDPHYGSWKKELTRYDIDRDTTLIGYSAGACLLLRYMSDKTNLKIAQMVLVKPWLDPNRKYGNFGKFMIDSHLTERCLGGLSVFYAPDDDDQVERSTIRIAEALPKAEMIQLRASCLLSALDFPELVDKVV